MGNKKGCLCGYWNEAQRECLYSGHGCIHDVKKPTVTKEFVGKWVEKLEASTTFSVTSGEVDIDRDDFMQMLTEAGIEVVAK